VGAKVLIVDDDSNVLRLMSYIVQQAGYEVLTAENGAAALMAVAGEHPTLLILDLMMPRFDGFEICEQVRGNPNTADIKILAVTGFAEPATMRRIVALGADGYVEKPLNVEEFLAKVGRLVGAG